jgi:phosphoserine phosphatase RsbU/P
MSARARLTWIHRITLILFATVVVNQLVAWTAGYSLLGSDFFTVLLIFSLIILALTKVRPLVRRLVWRVRHRLLITYFFVGVLPVALLLIFVFLGLYMILGQTANYLFHEELERRLDQLHRSAEQLATDIAAGAGRRTLGPDVQLIIRSARDAAGGFPPWTTSEFRGLVRNEAGTHFFAAHASAGKAERRVDIFAYQIMDDEVLARLLPDLASVMVISDAIMRVRVGGDYDPNPKLVLDSENVVPRPAARSFWDLDLESGSPLSVRSMEDGRSLQEAVVLGSRPSALIAKLFSSLGSFASVLGVVLLIIGICFLGVEIVALVFSAQLTRTLTRCVHDLYGGTKRVEAGDFSHRIPVRTKDQLSELARSFNTMTQRIEQLIVEVKDKEKLEAELEIARQVQAQLFPREVPALKTLELLGVCNPARVVSGDYYDFIPIDSRSTAVVIGDISGKGISAALLMASVQSSLRAQLRMGGNGIGLSTATLVSRLNRQLYESTPPEKYATFYCGFYDDQIGRLAYTNAGHLAPILIRRRSVTRLESNGMAVGLFPESTYEQTFIDLEAGDLLIAFTDGITESENAVGEQFGDRQLIDLVMRNRERPLDEIMRTITNAVRDWASDLDNQDDTTMLLARRL